MTYLQIGLVLFLIFAITRVILRFRDGQIKPVEFGFWAIVFMLAIFGVAFPKETSRLAGIFGIGRGVDLVFYISIALLFYLVFRIYVMLEDIHHEITQLIRQISLKEIEDQK